MPKKELNESLLYTQRDLLKALPWFSHCGQPLPEGFTILNPDPLHSSRYHPSPWNDQPHKIDTWQEARKHLRSRRWGGRPAE